MRPDVLDLIHSLPGPLLSFFYSTTGLCHAGDIGPRGGIKYLIVVINHGGGIETWGDTRRQSPDMTAASRWASVCFAPAPAFHIVARGDSRVSSGNTNAGARRADRISDMILMKADTFTRDCVCCSRDSGIVCNRFALLRSFIGCNIPCLFFFKFQV